MEKKKEKVSKVIGDIAGYIGFYLAMAVLFVIALGIVAAMLLGVIALNKWLWGLI